jgi:hypothetical protein
MESTIRQLDLNPNINDALFSKPEVAPAPSK